MSELAGSRSDPGSTPPPAVPRRERVLVALSGGPGSEHVLRRGARRTAREAAELHVVVVTGRDHPAEPPERLARLRALTDQLEGTSHGVVADDPAAAQ